MILVIGTVVVPAENMDMARDAMKQMMQHTLKEAGCVSYNLCEDLLEPGRLRISEEWETMAALEAHFAVPHMKVWREALAKVGATGRKVDIYDGTLVKSI